MAAASSSAAVGGRKASLSYESDAQRPLAAREAALRASAATGNPTPGQYIQRCRRAAKLSIAQVADRIGAHHRAKLWVEADLRGLEADRPGNHAALVRSLKYHAVFPFNLAMFHALAAATCAPALAEWEPA